MPTRRAGGTPEHLWAEWESQARLPRLDRPTGRVVVVSAHPDDEVLGAGGLIASLPAESTDLSFVVVTDGEASHRESPDYDAWSLAESRIGELRAALEVLGHPQPAITRLGLPDSALAGLGAALGRQLSLYVSEADLVICPSTHDGHPDHEVVADAVVELCAGSIPVWQLPIWTWHWTGPEESDCWRRAAGFDLSDGALELKRRALGCFTSQITPFTSSSGRWTTILPPEVLAHFTRPYEVFLR